MSKKKKFSLKLRTIVNTQGINSARAHWREDGKVYAGTFIPNTINH